MSATQWYPEIQKYRSIPWDKCDVNTHKDHTSQRSCQSSILNLWDTGSGESAPILLSGVNERGLTLCQSGRWNTLGGRGRLNPCALCHHAPDKRERLCPGDVRLCPWLLWISYLFCSFSSNSLAFSHFLFILNPNFVSIYCPLSCCVTRPAPLSVSLSSYHSHFSLAASGQLFLFEVLSVVTRVSQQCPSPHEYTATHIWMGFLPQGRAGSWLAATLSQWEAASPRGRWIILYDKWGCGSLTGLSS